MSVCLFVLCDHVVHYAVPTIVRASLDWLALHLKFGSVYIELFRWNFLAPRKPIAILRACAYCLKCSPMPRINFLLEKFHLHCQK